MDKFTVVPFKSGVSGKVSGSEAVEGFECVHSSFGFTVQARELFHTSVVCELVATMSGKDKALHRSWVVHHICIGQIRIQKEMFEALIATEELSCFS